MIRAVLLVMASCWACLPGVAFADLAPPTNVTATDGQNDTGQQIDVHWSLSVDDEWVGDVKGYAIFRKLLMTAEGLESTGEAATNASEIGVPANFNFSDVQPIGSVAYGKTSFTDENAEPGVTYVYGVMAVGAEGVVSSITTAEKPVTAMVQYFNEGKFWFLIIMLTISLVIIAYVQIAKGGGTVKVRTIAGLEAVTEAVGRATEMGKPVLFVPGILDINDIQTVAGITVLANVARTSAQYDAHLKVPTARSLVMTTARETVQAAYMGVGRPDAYNEDDIYYLTDEQFGYTAGVQGLMVRERPAACFYMGAFYAESLILAETANSIGAIQIAGTAMPSQLPFFVAACDYTLIGEEFFAASAYLSNDPEQLGSLKGQDIGKVIAAVLLVIGCVFATVAATTHARSMYIVTAYIKNSILGDEGYALEPETIDTIDDRIEYLAQLPHGSGGDE